MFCSSRVLVGTGLTCREEYERLVRGWRAELPHSSFMADYSRLIQKDVARTDKDQAFFKLPSTDQALTNILMALVYHDPSLGEGAGLNNGREHGLRVCCC